MYLGIFKIAMVFIPLLIVGLISIFLPDVMFDKIKSVITVIAILWMIFAYFIAWLFELKFRKMSDDSQDTISAITIFVLAAAVLLMLVTMFDIINLWMVLYIDTLVAYLLSIWLIITNQEKAKPSNTKAASSNKEKSEWIEIKSSVQYVGDLQLEKLVCESCGAPLDEDSISIKTESVQVSCPYCGSSYLSQTPLR